MNEYATDPNFYPHTQVCKNSHFLYFSVTELSCSSPDWQCKIPLHVSMAGSSVTAKVWGPYIVSVKVLEGGQHILPVIFPCGHPQKYALWLPLSHSSSSPRLLWV